jgi:hypothetical protein
MIWCGMLAVLVAAVLIPAVPQSPPNDPTFSHCLDARAGIELDWQKPNEDAKVYLLVKHLKASGEWEEWLKTEQAAPPFVLSFSGGSTTRGKFAWLLFSVPPPGVEPPGVVQGDWQYFCTR